MTALSSITLVEGMLGLSFQNVHILRDFFNVVMLIMTVGFTMKAIDIWNENMQEANDNERGAGRRSKSGASIKD